MNPSVGVVMPSILCVIACLTLLVALTRMQISLSLSFNNTSIVILGSSMICIYFLYCTDGKAKYGVLCVLGICCVIADRCYILYVSCRA